MEDKYWMIPSTTLASNKIRENDRADSRTRKSFKVKFCNKCRRCWEKTWFDCKLRIKYYDEFTTYGLERKDCEKCSEPS